MASISSLTAVHAWCYSVAGVCVLGAPLWLLLVAWCELVLLASWGRASWVISKCAVVGNLEVLLVAGREAASSA